MGKEVVITAQDLPDDVVETIKSGQKIEAIKLLRIATGLGLANAKVLVDAGSRLHGMKHRHVAMTDSNNTSAGFVTFLLMLLLSASAYFYFLN